MSHDRLVTTRRPLGGPANQPGPTRTESESRVETVRVTFKSGGFAGAGVYRINAVDFDPNVHELVEE